MVLALDLLMLFLFSIHVLSFLAAEDMRGGVDVAGGRKGFC